MRKRKRTVVKRGRAREQRKIPCEVYSRVVGYLRPVQNWNKGKRQEWRERKTYKLATALEGPEREKTTI